MKKILTLLVFLSTSLFADDVFVIVAKRQEQKKKNSWSLSEWMATKSKMSLMDSWLALHSSPNNVEFSLAGYQMRYTPSPNDFPEEQNYLRTGEASLYYKIFGLTGSYEHSNRATTSYEAQMNLRIFGKSIQGTNIVGFFGRKHFNCDESFDNNYWGLSSDIYLLPFLGSEIHYRRYLASKNIVGTRLEGSSFAPGFFVDIFLLRFSATYFKENLTFEKDSASLEKSSQGWKLGLKLFF